MITAVHTKVPGRARYRVRGLRQSVTLKQLLEERLAKRDEIARVSAGATTGTVLVRFDSNSDHAAIALIITDIVKEHGKRPDNPRGTVAKRKSPGSKKNIKGKIQSAKNKVKHLLSASEEYEKPKEQLWAHRIGQSISRPARLQEGKRADGKGGPRPAETLRPQYHTRGRRKVRLGSVLRSVSSPCRSPCSE